MSLAKEFGLAENVSRNMYFQPEPKTNSQYSKRCCVWYIRKIREELADEVCRKFYLCMPYLIGCDKMSSVWHRKGCVPVKGNEESPFLSTRGCFCGGTRFHRKTSSKLKKMLL